MILLLRRKCFASQRKSISDLHDTFSKLPEFPNHERDSQQSSKTSSQKVSNQNSPTSSDETSGKTFDAAHGGLKFEKSIQTLSDGFGYPLCQI